MADDEFRVRRLLTGLESALAETNSGFQFVVEDAVFAGNEEEIFDESLGGFALDVPIVLAEHFVVVFALFVVVPLLRKIFGAFLHRVFRGEEVGDELLAGLVHDAADHGLAHLLHLLGRLHPRGRGVRVEDHLGTGVLPHVGVGQDGHDLHRVDVGLAVVAGDRLEGVLEGLLDGGHLGVPVHVQVVHVHLLPHGEPNVRLHLLDGRRLVPGLLSGDIVGPPHPGEGDAVLVGPGLVGHRVHLLLQQLLVSGVHGRLVELVDGVRLGVDQVYGDAEVVLGEQLVLVVPL